MMKLEYRLDFLKNNDPKVETKKNRVFYWEDSMKRFVLFIPDYS